MTRWNRNLSQPRWISIVRTVGKVFVTLILLAAILTSIDEKAILNNMTNSTASHLAFGLLLLMLQVVLLSHRWAVILTAMDIRSSTWFAFRIFEIGLFFSQVLPSSIGGDGIRIWLVRGPEVNLQRAFDSVLIDRLTGLLGLIALILLGFPLLFAWVDEPTMKLSLTLLITTVMGGIALYFYLHRIIPFLGPIQRFRLVHWLLDSSRSARQIVWSAKRFFPVFGLAVIAHVLSPATVYVLAKGMMVELSLLQCLVLVPPVLLTMMLPVSIAGWGVREGAMVVSLGLVGVEPAQAVAVSITLGVLLLLASLPGGAFWLVYRHQPGRK